LNTFKIFVFCLISFQICACKKGENDPKISLLSRVDRLEGEWHIINATHFLTITENKETKVTKENLEEGIFYTYLFQNGTEISKTKGLFRFYGKLLINKNGTFKYIESKTGPVSNVRQFDGTWQFEDGAKDKVYLLFNVINSELLRSNFFYINELRNKKMVLSDETFASSKFGKAFNSIKIKSEVTMVQY
jgi:hypothetical protein